MHTMWEAGGPLVSKQKGPSLIAQRGRFPGFVNGSTTRCRCEKTNDGSQRDSGGQDEECGRAF